MKRSFCLLLMFLILLALPACKEQEPPAEAVYYTVTFETVGGGEIKPMRVLSGSLLTAPPSPEKDDYVFFGWTCDSRDWNFSENAVTKDITLTAKWTDAKNVFEYEITEQNTVTITGYLGAQDTVVMPKTLGGYPITAIGAYAFSGEDSPLRSLTLPATVTAVGDGAFADCSMLALTVLGELSSLGERAFYRCERLSEVHLASPLSRIPPEAFAGCTALTEIALPKTVTSIGENGFANCITLEAIIFHDSLALIEDSAFLRCENLNRYAYGTPQTVSAIEIHTGNEGNTSFTGSALFYYSESEPAGGTEHEYWHFNDSGKLRVW